MSVQQTSKDSFQIVCQTLPLRERRILDSLRLCLRDRKGDLPTSYELFEWMKSENGDALPEWVGLFDLNSVRPTLTKLKDERRLIEFGPRRVCSISGRSVHTIRFSDRALLASPRLSEPNSPLTPVSGPPASREPNGLKGDPSGSGAEPGPPVFRGRCPHDIPTFRPCPLCPPDA